MNCKNRISFVVYNYNLSGIVTKVKCFKLVQLNTRLLKILNKKQEQI